MSQPAAMKYSGTLYFEDGDGDRIDVRAFIVHDESISFDLVGGWGEHGMWERSGVATKVGPSFHSEIKPSYKDGVEGYPCKIIFSSITDGDIVGTWVEQGEERDFSGSLKSG